MSFARATALFPHLPAPLQAVAAAARGWQLRRWRYGADTDGLVLAAREREHWDAGQWQAWQAARLRQVLARAATRVPYYRAQWQARLGQAPSPGAAGADAPWLDLAKWPVLEKGDLRADPRAFLAEDCVPRHMFHEHTSGTTGTPVDLWWSRTTVREWYALFEARWRGWHGVSRHDRWGILGGQIVTPPARRRPPFWVWNAPMRQLYLSVYHLAPDLTPHYIAAIARHRLAYLWGYTSALYALAQDVLRSGRRDLRMRVVLTNAEPLSAEQRDVIGRAFQCPVRETYGMAEIAAAAGECEEGRLHLWPEAGLVEVMRPGTAEALPAGETGELVCTGLINADMPLIRYRLGDCGRLAPASARCACGRTLPLVDAVEGRADDVVLTADGRRIGRLDPVFKGGFPIREAQVVQETVERLLVQVVPAPGYGPDTAAAIRARLAARVGPMQIEVREVPAIPRAANGKFRAVVSRLARAGENRVRSTEA
jgi:phenylacetate-CoA ligase